MVSFSVSFGIESYNLIGSSRTDLPWEITDIQVVFSESITSADMNSLSGVTSTGFSGLGTNTLTWTFSQLSNGPYSAVLAGSGANAITSADGTLNGGSDFTQDFSVLLGDFNDDDQVNSADVNGVIAVSQGAYNIFADINGDGVVDITDANLIPVTTSIPEPSTLPLFATGLVALGLLGWRRKRR